MKISFVHILCTVFLVVGAWLVAPTSAHAAYNSDGLLVSTNLLSGEGASRRIVSFTYNLSALPSNTTAKISFSQFSGDSSTKWFNSSGTMHGWDTLTSGTHTIDLEGVHWSGTKFYYRVYFTSSDGVSTPLLDSISVEFDSSIGLYNTYNTTGTLVSTNLLSSQSVYSIDSFAYTVATLPANTTLTAQFSQNNSTWYNSSGTQDASNTLSEGSNTISLSTLAWSGANFYYRINYTSDGVRTPRLDSIDLNFTEARSISGTVYSDEGSTALGSQQVRLAVNGTDLATTTSNASTGAYSISVPSTSLASGSVVTLYLEDETADAVTTTIIASADLTSVDLYKDRLITRCDNSCSLTNANLTTAAVASENDVSGIYSVSGGALTLASGKHLFIPASQTFAPGGNVSLSGNWTNNGAYTTGTETVTFSAGSGTQTFKPSSSSSYYDLTHSGAGTLQLSTSNLTVTHALTNSAGTFDLNGRNFTATGATISNAGTIQLQGGETVTGFTNDTTQGTVAYVGTSTYTGLAAGNNYYHLTFNGFGGSWTSTATLDVNGNLTITTGTLNSAGQNITLAGNWSNAGAYVSGSNTVNFDAASGTQTLTSGGTGTSNDFNNVTKSGGGTLQFLTNGVDIDGTLTINASTIVDLAGINLSSVTTLVNNGTLKLQGGETLTGFTTDTDSGTVEYVGTSTYSSLAAGNNYYHLTFNGSGGSWTHTSTLDVNGNLTITLGTLLSSGQNVTLAGNFANSGTYTPGSNTLTLDGAADQTITTNNQAFNNLTLNNTGASGSDDIIIAGAFDINGTLTITDGDLDVSTNDPTVTLAGDVTIGASGTIDNAIYSGTWTFDGSGTDTLTDNTTAGTNFRAVTVDGTSSKVLQFSSGANTPTITFTTLTIGADDAVSLNGENATITTLVNNGTLRLLGSETVTVTTFDTDSGTTEYVGTGTYSSLAAGNSYYHLTFNGTGGTWTLGAALTVNNNLTITAGTLDASSSGNYDITVAGTWSNSGTFTARSGTVTLTGTSTFSDTTAFYNLTVNGSTKTVTLGAALTTTNNLTITAGTVDVSAAGCASASCAVTVSGNFANSGTFTARTGTITLNKSSGTQTLNSGGSSFYNLTHSGAGTLQLATNALTIANNLTTNAGTLDANGLAIAIAGNWANTAAFTANANTVTFNGAANQTFTTNAVTLAGLTLNNTGAAGSDRLIISGTLDVDGTLTITDGVLYLTTNNPAVNTAGAVTIGASGAMTKGTGTWTFDGSGTSTLTGNSQDFGTVTIDGASKTVQLGGAATFGTLTIGSDDIFDLAGTNVTITTLANNNTFRLQGGETVTVTTYDTDSGTTEYVGTGTYSSLAAGNNYYHLTFNGLGGSWTHASTLDVNGHLTVTLGTLISGGQTITLAGNWSNAGSYTSGSNTITFDAASGTQTLTSGGTGATKDFQNVTKSGGGTLQFLTNGVDIDGTLNISSSTTVDLNGQNLTSVTTLGNNGTLLLEGGETVTITTKDTDSGTVTYDGTGSYLTALAYGNAYYNLTFNGSGGVWEPNGAVTVNSNLTLTNGTFDIDSQNLTVTGTYSNDATLRLLGTETVTLTNDTNSGTTSYDNTATLSDFPANLDDTYYNLTLAGTGAVQLAAALDANNNLTVSSGATLNLNGFDFTVGGNFVNSGTLSNSSSRTLTLDGTTQTLNPASGTTLGTVSLTGSSGTVSAGSNFSISTLLSIAAGRVMNLVSYLLTSLGSLTNSGTITESSGYIIDASSGFYIADSNFDIDDAISIGSEAVYVTLTDEDGNLNGGSADTLAGAVVSCPTDSETVTLTETGAATEVFRNSGLATALYSGSATNNNGTLTCANNVTITATWTDPQDASDTQSDTATATTDTVPTAPSSFAGTAASSTSINWTWTDNASNETGFKLYSSAGTLLATIATANTTSYTETGLTASTSYTRKLVAYNAAGNSSFTSTATVTTDAAATPTPTPSTGAPTAPMLKSPANEVTLTTNTPTFTFTRSTDTDLANYSLRLTPASGSTEVITFNNPGEGSTTALSKATVTATADTISVTITDKELLNDGDWTWKVRATDDAANTTDSTSRSFTIDTSVANPANAGPATAARRPGTPATTTPTTTSELTTHPQTIEDIIEQIARGETPSKAPVALQLDELAKQAKVRQQKQAANLFAFLQRFIPYDKLTFFNNWFDRFLALLHNQVRTMAYQSLQRLAALTGFGREQLLALRELFTNRSLTLATEREQVTRTINQEFASVSAAQATALANVLLEAQQQVAARTAPPDQATLKRLRAAAPDLPTPDLTRLTELARNTVTQTNQTLLDRRTKAVTRLSGIPRFIGRTILAVQTTGSRLHGWLIAARTNRLQLARGNENRLNQAAVPVRIALNRSRLAAQLAYEALRGRQDGPLQIADVAITPQNSQAVTIIWKTNRLARGKINWGTTTSYGADQNEPGGEIFETDFNTKHTVTVAGLTAGTKYYFEVLATDTQNNSTADAYYSFVTP